MPYAVTPRWRSHSAVFVIGGENYYSDAVTDGGKKVIQISCILKVDICNHMLLKRPKDIPVCRCFLPAVAFLSWMKSSKTVLLHLGHRGSSSDSITYMRHLGHPTSIIDVASGLVEYRRDSSCWFSSDETHELGGDVGDTVSDRVGDSTRRWFSLGGDKFSFRSSFGPFLRLIFLLDL